MSILTLLENTFFEKARSFCIFLRKFMRKGKMSNSCRSMKVWRSESCTGWHSVVFAKRFLGDGVVDSPFPPLFVLYPAIYTLLPWEGPFSGKYSSWDATNA
jgi:hypothetical protein